jgi:hypothetical protein
MTDQLWEQYSLGAEYNAKDPATQQPAVRNPFWHRAPSPAGNYAAVDGGSHRPRRHRLGLRLCDGASVDTSGN